MKSIEQFLVSNPRISSWIHLAEKLKYPIVALSSLFAQTILYPIGNEGARFIGDDLEVLASFENGKYASTIAGSIRDFSLDKWRPINTLAMHFLLGLFGNNPDGFSKWSIALVVTLCLVATFVISRICSRTSRKFSLAGSILLSLVLSTSPFLFMPRTSVFGFLEITPILLVLLAYFLFDLKFHGAARPRLTYSVLLGLAAALIHERFLAFSIGMIVLCVLRARRDERYRGAWMGFAGNIFFYLYTSGIVLGANPLKGGGEYSLDGTWGIWIAHRLLVCLLHILGGSGGNFIYFSVKSPTELLNGNTVLGSFNLVVPILVSLIGIIIFISKSRYRNDERDLVDVSKLHPQQVERELFFLGLTLIIPAATVIGRIEPRWLFPTFVFWIIPIGCLLGSKFVTTKLSAVLLCIVFLYSNFAYRQTFDEFNWWRFRTTAVLTEIQMMAPSNGYWGVALVIDSKGSSAKTNEVIWWGLTYGEALVRYIDNAPNQILVGGQDVVSSCTKPCLVVEVWDEQNAVNGIFEFKNQRIRTTWTG